LNACPEVTSLYEYLFDAFPSIHSSMDRQRRIERQPIILTKRYKSKLASHHGDKDPFLQKSERKEEALRVSPTTSKKGEARRRKEKELVSRSRELASSSKELASSSRKKEMTKTKARR